MGGTPAGTAQRVLEQLPVAVAVLEGPRLRLTIPSTAWRARFGYGGPLEIPLAELGLFDADVVARIQQAAETGAPIHIRDARGDFIAQRLRDDDGQRVAVMLIEEPGSAAGLSEKGVHDLATPVATIVLWAQIVRNADGDPGVTRQAVDAIRDCAAQHAKLLASVRDPAATAAEDAVAEPASVAGALREVSLLVVDDDPHLLEALRQLLARTGAEAQYVSSADAALELLARTHFDVLITDLTMSDGDGFSLVGRIRQAGLDVGAIALTGLSTSADRARALASGFDLYLTKPVGVDRLVKGIATVLAQRQTRNV